jgi:hypothetical protein
MDAVWPYLAAIIPSIVVAVLFYFLIKGMLEGDRRERLAQSQFEAEQDRLRAESKDAAVQKNHDEPDPGAELPPSTAQNPRLD